MINALIIDDEPKAREALKKTVIDYCPDVNIQAMGASVEEAMQLIYMHTPDIIFLDIDMPNGNGFTLFEKIKNPNFEVIFTTAYEEYAIKAFRISAIDYLTKPIDFRLLKEAITKFKNKQKVTLKEQRLELLIQNMANRPTEFSKMAIPNSDGFTMVKITNIIYCKADGSYTDIHLLNGKKIVATKILKDIEEFLPTETFYKIHRSHIVNLNLIKEFIKTDGYQVIMEDGTILDVSERNKKEFIEKLTNR